MYFTIRNLVSSYAEAIQPFPKVVRKLCVASTELRTRYLISKYLIHCPREYVYILALYILDLSTLENININLTTQKSRSNSKTLKELLEKQNSH